VPDLTREGCVSRGRADGKQILFRRAYWNAEAVEAFTTGTSAAMGVIGTLNIVSVHCQGLMLNGCEQVGRIRLQLYADDGLLMETATPA
jgi:hypothetical protein